MNCLASGYLSQRNIQLSVNAVIYIIRYPLFITEYIVRFIAISQYIRIHTDATCISFCPDAVDFCPVCLGVDEEQLGLGDLAGDPLPFPGTVSTLARLIARRSSPDVTVAGEADDGVDVPQDCLLKYS